MNEKPDAGAANAKPAGTAAEGEIAEAKPAMNAAEAKAAVAAKRKPAPAPTPFSSRGETMEIHAPEKPIHSKKEFIFHMFTVVLGILIALGLEGIVEWAHHRALVREARANITIELRHNKETIENAMPQIADRKKQLQHVISTIDEVEKTRKLAAHSLGYKFESYELYSTAWKTASVSGAVTHMDYEELKDYTDIYDLQQDFLTVQSQGFPAVGELTAAMHVLNHDLTKVPADRLEDIQRAAAKILTVQEALGNVAYGLTQGYNKTLK